MPDETIAIPQNQVEVVTWKYAAQYGHDPRGNGNWGFGIGDEKPEHWIFHNGKYSDVKKLAVAKAAKAGIPIVYVLT